MSALVRAITRWGNRNSRSQGDGLPLTLDDYANFFTFNGLQYPFMPPTSLAQDRELPPSDFGGYVTQLYKNNGVVFACMAARQRVFSQARFQFQRMNGGTPGDLFGTQLLAPLEHPWGPSSTTGDMLSRMIQDVDLAGNAYIARMPNGNLAHMRPDWVIIIAGSKMSADRNPNWQLDAECIGYVYTPGGPRSGEEPILLLPQNVAHFAPHPDPTARFRGMSWLTPVVREVMGDSAAMTHKLKFFENGASPNVVVSLSENITPEAFAKFVEMFEDQNAGVAQAYKTLFFGGGASIEVVGSDLKQLDFKVTQGHGEPLALDTPIPTPTGWTTMGDIKVGDQVFGRDGKAANVVGTSPIHTGRDCFRISFSDRTSIVADAVHAWPVADRDGHEHVESIKTTAEMVAGITEGCHYGIPAGEPDSLVDVVAIEPVESVPVQCITVDTTDHLFRAGAGQTLTHNTRIAAASGVPPIVVGLSEGLEASTYSLPFDGSVWTCAGPRAIGDIRPGDHVWTRLDGRLVKRRVMWQGQTGENVVYTVKTKNRTFRATGNHPVLMPDGSWRHVENLTVGDRLLAPLGLPEQGGTTLPDGAEATPEIMRWLGAFTGDGCLNGDHGVRMCIPIQDRVRGHYVTIPPRLFTKSRQGSYVAPNRRAKDGLTERMVQLREQGKTFRQIRDEMSLSLHPMSIRDRVQVATREYRGVREPVEVADVRHAFQFSSKQAVTWHHTMGVTGTAKTKRVPGWIFELREDLRLAYLAGVVDTDGSIGKDGRLVVQFANRALVEDVRMLLVSCGVQCSNIADYHYTQANLPQPGNEVAYFAWRFTASSAADVARIPFADELYRERVEANSHRQRLNQSGTYRIVSVECGTVIEPVYDIEVEGGHSFLADGVIVHNSNYGQARRAFADGTLSHLWENAAGSLETLIDIGSLSGGGSNVRLWYDDKHIRFLKADVKEDADVQQVKAATINTLITSGFTPDDAVKAVEAADLTLLVGKHTGLVSVQLFRPGAKEIPSVPLPGKDGKQAPADVPAGPPPLPPTPPAPGGATNGTAPKAKA